MTLERWKLPVEGYLPLFSLLSAACAAAMLFFVRVQVPPLSAGGRQENIAQPQITLLAKASSAAEPHVKTFHFLSKYALLPGLPAAEISLARLQPPAHATMLAQLPAPQLVEPQPLACDSASPPISVGLVSLLPIVGTIDLLSVEPSSRGEIVFVGSVPAATSLPSLPAIATDTPLRASVYYLSIDHRGFVQQVLLLESSGKTEADRIGIGLLRTVRFLPQNTEKTAAARVTARIFWPQIPCSSPSR